MMQLLWNLTISETKKKNIEYVMYKLFSAASTCYIINNNPLIQTAFNIILQL